jgi:transglycosylase-like protein
MQRNIPLGGALAALALTTPAQAASPPVDSYVNAATRAALVQTVVRLQHRLHMPVHRDRLARMKFSALRAKVRVLRRERAYASAAVPPVLASIAACESGGNPQAIGGGGAFRGKYQFTYATWAAVGGSGDPAAASEAEQDMRAAILYQRAGAGQWPVCGR